jgi:16S rRNA G966 N2-methylase RsmD
MERKNILLKGNCLEKMKEMPDKSVDLFFTDPPYALGSEVIIRKDGKPDYKKAVDFMNKWEQPDGAFWEAWFKEAFRILKHGGRVVMFGMDRQLMLNKYYACFAGFQEQQSLYWYFISNFPKASDLSKNIDKNAGAEREVIGTTNGKGGENLNLLSRQNGNDLTDSKGIGAYGQGAKQIDIEIPLTAPSTPLAKKYSGYKYSVSPLKQTCETIMVFQKPYKTGSCLHDVLLYENGDMECLCGAINVDGGRVLTDDNLNGGTYSKTERIETFFKGKGSGVEYIQPSGRYPSQTFVDTEIANLLDEQSGIKKSGAMTKAYTYQNNGSAYGKPSGATRQRHEASEGGCSKILHKCDYDEVDFDLYIYCPKVSKSERGAENNHPTVKPISLITKVLSLFKTPNKQVVVDCFMGSGTTGMVCANLDIDFYGIEMDDSFFDIAQARIASRTKQQNKHSLFVNAVAVKPQVKKAVRESQPQYQQQYLF